VDSDPSRLTMHVLHSGNEHYDYLHPHQPVYNPP
jgi:hypothetical protein